MRSRGTEGRIKKSTSGKRGREDRRARERCQVVFCSSNGRVDGRTKEFAASRVAAEKEISAGGEIGKKTSADNVRGQFRERDQIDCGIRLNGGKGAKETKRRRKRNLHLGNKCMKRKTKTEGTRSKRWTFAAKRLKKQQLDATWAMI